MKNAVAVRKMTAAMVLFHMRQLIFAEIFRGVVAYLCFGGLAKGKRVVIIEKVVYNKRKFK